jgi:F-type H+-transporting ATPase subunit b
MSFAFLSLASAPILASGGAFYTDSKFWVLVPLLLFFAFITWKGAFKAIGASLDSRADAIRTELDEARRLREEAQALLASYHRKQKEAEDQAEDIVAQARRDAEAMAEQSRRDLNERLERRAKTAEAKIANAEAQAISEVRSKAADMAVEMAEDMLRGKLTAADQTRLFKDGLSGMGRLN